MLLREIVIRHDFKTLTEEKNKKENHKNMIRVLGGEEKHGRNAL